MIVTAFSFESLCATASSRYASIGDERVRTARLTRRALWSARDAAHQCVWYLFAAMQSAAASTKMPPLSLQAFAPCDESAKEWVDRCIANVKRWRDRVELEVRRREDTASCIE